VTPSGSAWVAGQAAQETACLRDPAFLRLVFRARAMSALDTAEQNAFELAGFLAHPATSGITPRSTTYDLARRAVLGHLCRAMGRLVVVWHYCR